MKVCPLGLPRMRRNIIRNDCQWLRKKWTSTRPECGKLMPDQSRKLPRPKLRKKQRLVDKWRVSPISVDSTLLQNCFKREIERFCFIRIVFVQIPTKNYYQLYDFSVETSLLVFGWSSGLVYSWEGLLLVLTRVSQCLWLVDRLGGCSPEKDCCWLLLRWVNVCG